MNVVKIKGTHNAIKNGMLAVYLEAVYDVVTDENTSSPTQGQEQARKYK